MRILQYVFCILSVLCAASAVIVGIFTKSVLGAAIVAAGCIFFAVLMLLVKKKLEPPAPKKRGRPAGSANKKPAVQPSPAAADKEDPAPARQGQTKRRGRPKKTTE